MSNKLKGIDWLVQLDGATLTTDPASDAETRTGTATDVAVTPASMMAGLAHLAFPVSFYITGASKVINFANVTPGFADADDAFIAIGTWNDGLDISSQSQHFVPIQVHLDSNTSVAKDIAAARLRVDTDVDNTLTAIGCLQLRQSIGHNVASSAILNASVSISGTPAVQTGSILGGYFSIEGSGVITKAGDNDCTPLVAVNNNTGGGIDNVIVAMMNGTGTSVDEIVKIVCEHGTAKAGLDIEKTANGTALTTAIKISGTMTQIFDFTDVVTAVLEDSKAAPDKAGSIAILTPAGAVAYINYYDGTRAT
jgi:hypothetical protein